MGISDIFSAEPKDKLNWEEAGSLWSIVRFKIAGLTITEIFTAQAKDRELKDALNKGMEMLIIPHIEKVQKFLHSEGLDVPAVPQRKNLDFSGKAIEPDSYIRDELIAHDIREVYKYGLELDLEAVTSSVRDDVRQLAWSILNDDYKGFTAMLKLHKSKNWLAPPPTV